VYIKNWNLLKITQTYQQFTYVIIVITIYLFLGTLVFSLGEQWSPLDALYFCIITITTIGLGDLYPIHNKMLVFCFSCIGLGLVALLVSFLCEIINNNSNITSIQNIIRYPNSKKKILSVNNFQDWINQENIDLYHNGNFVWAVCLKDTFTFKMGKSNYNGVKGEWLLIWKDGKMYSMSDSDFSIVYEKVRKRDQRDSLYRLRIRFLAYNCNHHQFSIVQLRDHGKDTEIIQAINGTYVVYDIISDSIFTAKQFYFERDYKVENRVRIDYEKLKESRILIDKIRLEHQMNEINYIDTNINELQDEIIV
jgi:voltage-gated potassium channel